MIKLDTDQTVEIDTVNSHMEVDLSMNKIIEMISVCQKLQRKY